MMRLTSGFITGALVRRVEGEGAYATIARHGDDTAGAIFVLVDGLEGRVALYGPALPRMDDEPMPEDAALTGNRLFRQRWGDWLAGTGKRSGQDRHIATIVSGFRDWIDTGTPLAWPRIR